MPGDFDPKMQVDDVPGRQLTDQGRERKQQLVEAAAVLFAERGYAATRISDICQAAGAAKGLFYWYFPTKQDLFVELVNTMRRRLRRAQAASMDPQAEPIWQLRQGAVASVRFITDHASYFSFVQMERSDPGLATAVSGGRDVYLSDVIDLIEQAQQRGQVGHGDPALMAHGVVGAVWSFTEAWRQGHLAADPADLAEFVGDWVLRALSAPAATGQDSSAASEGYLATTTEANESTRSGSNWTPRPEITKRAASPSGQARL
jgi:AcrR family transcriptional regulator